MPCLSVDRMSSTQDFNVYVGAETGLFKGKLLHFFSQKILEVLYFALFPGVNFNHQQIIAKNLNNLQSLDRQQEITCIAWGNVDESEILIGTRNQKVKIYDTEFKGFSGCVETSFGTGPLRGVGKFHGYYTSAFKNSS